jgi:hypothetical protein
MIQAHASPSAKASTARIRLAGRLSDSVLAAFECEASCLTVSVEPADMVRTTRSKTRRARQPAGPNPVVWPGGGRGPAASHHTRRAWGEPEPPR